MKIIFTTLKKMMPICAIESMIMSKRRREELKEKQLDLLVHSDSCSIFDSSTRLFPLLLLFFFFFYLLHLTLYARTIFLLSLNRHVERLTIHSKFIFLCYFMCSKNKSRTNFKRNIDACDKKYNIKPSSVVGEVFLRERKKNIKCMEA